MTQVTVQQALEFARKYHLAGELRQAEAIYRQILAAHPEHADALHLLGVLAIQSNQLSTAIELINRAIAVHSTDPDYHYNLGQALAAVSHHDQAIQSYRRAIALKPDFGDAYNNLAIVLDQCGRLSEAIECFRKALASLPHSGEIHSNLSGTLYQAGYVEESLAEARRGILLSPESGVAHAELGAALFRTGNVQNAISSLRRAVSINPSSARAHQALGIALLLTGQFEEGWRESEWRRRVPELRSVYHSHAQPIWDGSDLRGRRILIEHEQGFGDTIQFARYVPMVAARGGRVIFGVPPSLVRLTRTVEGVEQVVSTGDALPPFDVYCPLLSLPSLFHTTLHSIPATVPYMRTDPELVSRWRQRLSGNEGRMKIALAWAGNSNHKDDRYRSVPLSMFASLAEVPRAQFYSLQKGDAARQTHSLLAGFQIADFTAEMQDFADSAAFIESMDLLISVDTAPAHLAAAFGKPVWLLLPCIPDWRWMLGREDSPWYPTTRLFRQSARGDWTTPISRLAAALRQFADT